MGKRINWATTLPCASCGLQGPEYVCLHHVLTRKAYPEYENERFNLMPLCKRHHIEIHLYGNTRMASTYPRVAMWFADNGWGIRNGKWVPSIFL